MKRLALLAIFLALPLTAWGADVRPGMPPGGAVGGSGTDGTIAKFCGVQTLCDSIATESGTTITIGGTLNATNFNGIIGATTPAAFTGTTGTFTGQLRTTNGSALVKAYNFLKGDGSADATLGFHTSPTSTSSLVFGVSNVNRVVFNNNANIGLILSSVGGYHWTSTTDADATVDTSITRLSAGVVRVASALDVAAAANIVPLTISGYSVTGSGTSSLASYSGTLNTSGVTHVNDWSITNTASGAGSTLFRIRGGAAGATHLFSVETDGDVGISFNSTFGVQTSGPKILFQDVANTAAGFAYSHTSSNTLTSGQFTFSRFGAWTWSPPSGSASSSMLQLNPIINGTSSGKFAALSIASVTNTLTGNSGLYLIDAGTSTTDYFTGYTQRFSVDTAGNTLIGGSATVTTRTGTPAAFACFDSAGKLVESAVACL